MRASLIVLILLFVFAFMCNYFAQQDTDQPADFFDILLEDLMKIEVELTAALTKMGCQMVPACVTTITKDQIRSSEDHSLNEFAAYRLISSDVEMSLTYRF